MPKSVDNPAVTSHRPVGMYRKMATLVISVSQNPIRSKLKNYKYAKASMREAAQENPANFALAATNSSINAAIATVESIMCWIARRSSRRERQAPLTRRHLGPRSRKARAAANKAARDGEPTSLLPCKNNRASRFMSQICLRRNLAALEFIRMTILKPTAISQLHYRPTLYRTTLWLLRSLRRQARDLGT